MCLIAIVNWKPLIFIAKRKLALIMENTDLENADRDFNFHCQ